MGHETPIRQFNLVDMLRPQLLVIIITTLLLYSYITVCITKHIFTVCYSLLHDNTRKALRNLYYTIIVFNHERITVLFEEERLKKAMKMFMESVPAVRAWREVGRELGLTADDLEAIGGPVAEIKRPSTSKAKNVVAGNVAEMQYYAEKMLKKWIEMTGDEATTSEIIEVLKYRKLNDIAGNVCI